MMMFHFQNDNSWLFTVIHYYKSVDVILLTNPSNITRIRHSQNMRCLTLTVKKKITLQSWFWREIYKNYFRDFPNDEGSVRSEVISSLLIKSFLDEETIVNSYEYSIVTWPLPKFTFRDFSNGQPMTKSSNPLLS